MTWGFKRPKNGKPPLTNDPDYGIFVPVRRPSFAGRLKKSKYKPPGGNVPDAVVKIEEDIIMIEEIKKLVETGKLKKIEEAVQEALDGGADPAEVLDSMTGAMDSVGEKFQKNEIYVPEMLVAAKTMQRGVNVLKPHLGAGGVGKYGKFVIGTVAGDLHDIGKNLVAMMIESAGFEVIDLGVDVPAEKFVETLKANPDCKMVGLSALLTTTMDYMEATVKAIKEAGLEVTIMVGGAPITQAFADKIGANAYTANAAAAATKAKELAA